MEALDCSVSFSYWSVLQSAFIGNLFGWFVGGLIGALIGLLIAHNAAIKNARFADHPTPVLEERQCIMGSRKLEFLLNGIAVGYFEESEYPRQDGRYRYVPYRSVGHYQMHTGLEYGHVRCYYTLGPEKVSFAVLDCPEYGILELADFRHERKE